MSSTRAPKPPSASSTSTRSPASRALPDRTISSLGPDDRVAALEGGARRERAQAACAVLELRAAALERAGAARGASRSCVPSSRCRARSRLRRAPRSSPARERSSRSSSSRQVGDDEPAGDARSRGADVGGEVAERRVLLVADRAHDRHRAVGDRAHEPLVAERAAGPRSCRRRARRRRRRRRSRAEGAQRLDDGARRRAGPGRSVSATSTCAGGKRVVIAVSTSRLAAASLPVTSPIRRGQERQRPLALGCEQPFGGELLPSAARAPPGARRGRSARARARAAGTRRAPRTAPVGRTTWTRSPSASSSRSASNWPRGIETPRHDAVAAGP